MKTTTSTIEEKQLTSKNFGLTRAKFNQLVNNLHRGDDELFRQVFTAHFDDCMQYLQRNYHSSHTNAYDATMDTLLLFCQMLKEGKVSYGNLRFLFTRMASQHYVRVQKKASRNIELDDQLELLVDTSSSSIPEHTLDALNKAWNKLGPNCQKLLKSFYYDRVKLKDIALQLGKSDASLRKQKERCLRKLQTLFQQIYPS